MSSPTNVTNKVYGYALPVAIGCAIGYFGARRVQRKYTEDLPARSEVCIDLITLKKGLSAIKKVDSRSIRKVSRVSLAEFLKTVSYKELNDLREDVDWWTRSKEIWDRVIPNSTYIVCVFEEDEAVMNQRKLIAGGFLMGNGRKATVVDIAVLRKYQDKRVGALVMNRIVKYIKDPGEDYADINLQVSEEDKMKFYAKFGFKKSHAMEASAKDLHEHKMQTRDLLRLFKQKVSPLHSISFLCLKLSAR